MRSTPREISSLRCLIADSLRMFMRPSVLVYHHIGSRPCPGDARDTVQVIAFGHQMAMLREKGFSVVPLGTLVSLLQSRRRIRPRTVAVTFDDGYSSTCARALPVLRSYDIPSTVFLATAFIGKRRPFGWLSTGDDVQSLPMDWDQAGRLHREGVEIGSHTAKHLFLPLLGDSDIGRELGESKEVIADRLGCVVRALALPYSYPIVHKRWPSFERVLTGAMKDSSYTSCSTLSRGRPVIKQCAVFLPRVTVMGHDSLAVFYAKALGLYGYTSLLQSLYQKHLKNYRG